MSTVQEIEQAALKLEPKTRALLAGRLLESLETKEEKEIAAAWAVEAESRLTAYESGELKTVPADEVFKYPGRSAQ